MTTSHPSVPLLASLQRATDTYLYVADLLEAFSQIRSDVVERLGRGTMRMAEDKGFLKLPDSPVADALHSEFKQRLEGAAETKAAQYPEWLINQGLVSLCTIFDVFLEGLVDAVLESRVEILYGVAGAKNIELKRLVELGSLESVLADFRAKEVKKFGFLEIRERFGYLRQRLSFDTDSTFRFERFTEEARKALEHWDLDRLVSVYKQRHGIVHRDERPFGKIEKLEECNEVLSKLIIDLTAQAQAVHKVMNDGSASLTRLIEAVQPSAEESPPS